MSHKVYAVTASNNDRQNSFTGKKQKIRNKDTPTPSLYYLAKYSYQLLNATTLKGSVTANEKFELYI